MTTFRQIWRQAVERFEIYNQPRMPKEVPVTSELLSEVTSAYRGLTKDHLQSLTSWSLDKMFIKRTESRGNQIYLPLGYYFSNTNDPFINLDGFYNPTRTDGSRGFIRIESARYSIDSLRHSMMASSRAFDFHYDQYSIDTPNNDEMIYKIRQITIGSEPGEMYLEDGMKKKNTRSGYTYFPSQLNYKEANRIIVDWEDSQIGKIHNPADPNEENNSIKIKTRESDLIVQLKPDGKYILSHEKPIIVPQIITIHGPSFRNLNYRFAN